MIFDGILETLASKTGRSTRMWRLLAVGRWQANLVEVGVAALLISPPREADVGFMKLYRFLKCYPQVVSRSNAAVWSVARYVSSTAF